MSVTAAGFRGMAERARELAAELCDGRLVVTQEGGYSLDHLPICTLAVVEVIAGMPPSFEEDPLEMDVPTELGPAEKAAIEAALQTG